MGLQRVGHDLAAEQQNDKSSSYLLGTFVNIHDCWYRWIACSIVNTLNRSRYNSCDDCMNRNSLHRPRGGLAPSSGQQRVTPCTWFSPSVRSAAQGAPTQSGGRKEGRKVGRMERRWKNAEMASTKKKDGWSGNCCCTHHPEQVSLDLKKKNEGKFGDVLAFCSSIFCWPLQILSEPRSGSGRFICVDCIAKAGQLSASAWPPLMGALGKWGKGGLYPERSPWAGCNFPSPQGLRAHQDHPPPHHNPSGRMDLRTGKCSLLPGQQTWGW